MKKFFEEYTNSCRQEIPIPQLVIPSVVDDAYVYPGVRF